MKYNEKQEAKRERYLERASKAGERSIERFEASHKATAGIPLGQPILIGHHSEKRHRTALKRSDNAMRKSIEEQEKAEYYREKAEAVGTGGISSDDPEAIKKLKSKLEKAQRLQEIFKKANKIIRRKPKNIRTDEKIAALFEIKELSKESAEKLFEPDYIGRIGFAQYQLSNNNANIRRMKQRLASLEAATQRETKEVIIPGVCKVVQNVEENRIQLIFDGRPEAAIRMHLKQNGFRWSPRNTAWQRHFNNAGIYATKRVIKQIEGE